MKSTRSNQASFNFLADEVFFGTDWVCDISHHTKTEQKFIKAAYPEAVLKDGARVDYAKIQLNKYPSLYINFLIERLNDADDRNAEVYKSLETILGRF